MEVLTAYEVAGLLVTFGTATLAYVRSSQHARGQAVIGVSVLGAILTMLVSLRFDVLLRVEQQLGTSNRLHRVEMAAIADKLTGAAEAVRESREPLAQYVFQARLRSLERDLDLLSKGSFVVNESEMPEFALRMISSAQRTIAATSYVELSDWWETPWGRRYEEENIRAVRRGVSIERTFIFSDRSEQERAKPFMDRQVASGIRVYCVLASDLRQEVSSDLVVIDNRIGGELRLTPTKGMTEALFFTAQNDIAETSHRVDAVAAYAERYRIATEYRTRPLAVSSINPVAELP